MKRRCDRSASIRRFDLFLIDVNMPRMSGLATITAVRRLPHYACTPIFVLTSEGTTKMIEDGRRAGASAWFVKPLNPLALLEAIGRELGASSGVFRSAMPVARKP